MDKLFSSDAMQANYDFVLSQATHVERQAYAVKYPDIQYQNLIPVDTSAHPFAKTVTFFSTDKFGQAKWINGNSDDIPLAGTERDKSEVKIHMAGIGYGYGYEEINQARMLSQNLPADDAMAARRAYEEMVDRVALYGDSDKGFEGLLNNPNVTTAAVSTGSWATATEDQILADINELLLGMAASTDYAMIASTLLLPHAKLNYLATNRLGDTQQTILGFLRQNNTYTAMTGNPLTIRAVRGMETAGAGGTDRMMAYDRSPQTMKLHIPMPHRFLETYRDGPLNYVVPGIFRLAGLNILDTRAVMYGDGI